MVSAARPPPSARSMAARSTRSRVSGTRVTALVSVGVGVCVLLALPFLPTDNILSRQHGERPLDRLTVYVYDLLTLYVNHNDLATWRVRQWPLVCTERLAYAGA